ncbi:MAG TPA: CHAT domain-containing protein, partial [Leptolyngbyaceae cyanobacterium]
ASNLTLNAGTGNITFSGAVGGTTALTGLSTNAANTNVADNITTTGNIQFNSPVTLTGGGSKTFNSNNNNIGFGSTVNGASNLTLNAGTGNITFSGAVGGTTALTGLSTNAANTNVADNITTTGNIQFNSPVTVTDSGSKIISAGTGAIAFNSTVTVGTNNLTLTADEIDFKGGNNSVSGSGNLLIQPFTLSRNLTLGGDSDSGTSTFDLTTTELAALKDGFNSLTIGRSDSSGTFNINSVSFLDPVTIQSPNGLLNTQGTINSSNNNIKLTSNINLIGETNINAGTGNISFAATNTVNGARNLTLDANNIALGGEIGGTTPLTNLTVTGNTTVANNISTTGNIQFNSPVNLTTGETKTFSANNIGFSNIVNGASNLTLNVGTGNITFGGEIGGITALTSLTATAANTNVNGNITTTGAQTYNSDVKLNNSVELNTTNSAVTFNRKVESQNTNQNLTVKAGTGNITFNDAVGSTTALGNLSTNSTGTTKFASTVQAASLSTSGGNTEINGNITTTGTQSYKGTVRLTGDIILTANEIDFLGGNSSVSGSGKLTLQPFTSSQGIVVNGNEGTPALDISTQDVLALKDGFSSLVIGAGDGSGDITLNPSNNFLDNLEVRSPNGNILNNGLAVNGTVKLDAATTTLNGNITAQGQIDIPKKILLGANVTLNSNGSNMTLGSTVDGSRDLTLNAGNTGTLTFGGAVGSTNSFSLTNLTVNAGNTNIGNNITTTGTQTFNSPIQLTGNATLSAGNNIAFNNTINGNRDLTVFTPANVSFGDIVGGTTKLNSLTTSAANIVATEINTNSHITLTANNTVTTGNLTTQGGHITVTSQNGDIKTGDLNSNVDNVTLTANNKITTGNLTTQGGHITVTSQNGNIKTGNLDSNVDRNGNGGDITLQTLGVNTAKIETGTISSRTNEGNGGDVTVQAPSSIDRRAIVLQWINAEGGNLGGNVDIKTRGFFRTEGLFQAKDSSFASISTIGGRFGNGGTIKIDHGGDGFNPFYVGRADINGTPGRITTGENFINPLEFFANSETRGKIQIITQGQVVPGKDELPAPQVVINNTTSSVASAIANVEDAVTSQFEQKLNLGRVRRKSQQEIISDLQEIEKKTQIKAGLVYVEFSNQSLPLNTTKANEQRKDSDPLVLLMVSPDGQLTRHLVPGVNRGNFQKIADKFYKEVSLKDRPDSSPDLQKLKTTSYKQSSQQLYKWLISPLEVQLKNKGINNLLFVMRDARLRSLPIAALMDEQEKFLVEKYNVSMIPSFNLINPQYVQSKNLEVLAMGAENFDPGPNNSNQITELLAAPIEAETIVNQIWQGRGRTLINQDFTYKRVTTERSPAQPFGIIHLATHAVFTTGDPLKSYIQLYDRPLTLKDMKNLGWDKHPQVDLLILSACQTAYGDEDSQLGLAGAAVMAGVRSVVASLWQVSDTGTLGLMTEFHRQLQKQPIKVKALRQAQLALIQGAVSIDQEGKNLIIDNNGLSIPLEKIAVSSTEAKQLNLKHPFFWASFTMIGSPW